MDSLGEKGMKLESGRWKMEVGRWRGDYPISGTDYNLVEDFPIVIRMGTTELAIGNSLGANVVLR